MTHKKDLYAAEALLKGRINSITVLHCPDNTTRDQLTAANKQYDMPITFCEKPESQPSTANNFIVYLKPDNAGKLVDSMEKYISEYTSAMKSGGTIVFIILRCEGSGEKSDYTCLREHCVKWAGDLNGSAICINCIITSGECTNESAMKTCRIAIDLIYNQNLLYSGQLFYA